MGAVNIGIQVWREYCSTNKKSKNKESHEQEFWSIPFESETPWDEPIYHWAIKIEEWLRQSVARNL